MTEHPPASALFPKEIVLSEPVSSSKHESICMSLVVFSPPRVLQFLLSFPLPNPQPGLMSWRGKKDSR